LSVLTVPVHIDALCLTADLDVAGPSVDFTRLPYVDPVTGRDVGADLPYLGEILLPVPFEDQNSRLKAGIHLHWTLPDALTRLLQSERETRTPVVPNRWLVTRSRQGAVEQQWVVESDALSDDNTAGVAYPVIDDASEGRPFRYLGRTVRLPQWDLARDQQDRLPELTVSGYGEPAFAAFYPNCHSVFGFYDPGYPGDPPPGLCYDVMGWYGDADQDELAQALKAVPENGSWQDTVAERLAWAAPPDAARPRSMVCFGQLVFAPADNIANPLPTDTESGVYIGNTATEALAAHLGSVIPGATPDDLENLLEALTYADQLESATLDLSIGLTESRHTAAFSPVPGGVLWSIRRQDETNVSVTAQEKQDRDRLPLPPALDDLLGTLNEAQSDYDRAWRTITGYRQRLFADWYKYMLCAYPPETSRDSYPDPDEVAFHVRRGMAELDDLVDRAGVHPPEGEGDTLAHRLVASYRAVDAALAEVNRTIGTRARTSYVVQQVPPPRYYVPNEPVVLLTGSAAMPSDRHGQDGAQDPDGLLTCWAVDAQVGDLDTAGALTGLRGRVSALVGSLPSPNPAVRTWSHAPWHPMLLHWEVEFFPTSAGNNLDAGHRDYGQNFVTDNYTLASAEVELRSRAGRNVPDKAANVYSGTTILSPSARPVMSTRVLRYLTGNVLAGYNKARSDAELPTIEPETFRADPGAVLDWYDAEGEDPRLHTLVAVYRHLAANEAGNLSQSLGGFNDALLMLKVARQLPVADPLGFPDRREFTAQVAARIGDENRHAPQPLSDFNPIRAGALRVRRLRMVDNFGTTHDIDVSRLRTTTRLRVEDHPDWVAMPPRLAQPARISLRLLDAGDDVRPLTGLPACSPICGLLVPDTLDDSLRICSTQGRWLGSVYAFADPASPGRALWQAAPDGDVVGGSGAQADIQNPHLRAVAERLCESGAEGVGRFLRAIDEGLAAVDPENHAQHPGRAVLMGRPIAVVRAEVGLEMMEPPAVHQDWNVFRQDMARSGRETNDFPLVRFPVRIGEHDRLGDGVLGYWLEALPGGLGTDYHDVQGAAEPVLEVAIDLPPRYLTLLVDPRGAVHATSGILPTESVRIAAEHYQDAIGDLEVGFLAAPVLTDADGIAVPLPAEPGFSWSWRERDRTGWVQTADPPQPPERFPAGLTVREGRLTLRPTPSEEGTL
jgi:hypothetical protein